MLPALRLLALGAGWVLLLAGAPAAGQGECTVHPPGGGSGLGEPVLIDFGPDSTITTVFVRVQEGLLRPWVADAVALDITITSVDGIAHFHGTDVIPLSGAAAVGQSENMVTLAIPWTADEEPQVVGDLYTVCAQLVTAAPLGPERCNYFGPFF